MCPSYKFVVRLMRPIFDRPKSVSLMWPIEVMRRLYNKSKVKLVSKLTSKEHFKNATQCFGALSKMRSLSLVRLEVPMHYAIIMQVL